MPVESSLLQRVQMFEGGTPKKQIGGVVRARAPKDPEEGRREDGKHDPPQTLAAPPTKQVGMRSIEWPSDDEREIPAPRNNYVDTRDVPEHRYATYPLQNRSSSQSQRAHSGPPAKAQLEKRGVPSKQSFDENTNPDNASLDWPTVDNREDTKPSLHQPSRLSATEPREGTRTELMRKHPQEPGRHPVFTLKPKHDVPMPLSRAITKSQLNYALKQSLSDASTVLHEERASSVATSSSSLSSDELTNIAKRALRASQQDSVGRRLEDDDTTIGTVSTSRSARYSAARQRIQSRRRYDDDDVTSVSSIKSSQSQNQFQSRAMALALRAQHRKSNPDDKVMPTDDVSNTSNDRRRAPPIPMSLPPTATPPRQDATFSRQVIPIRKEITPASQQQPTYKCDQEVKLRTDEVTQTREASYNPDKNKASRNVSLQNSQGTSSSVTNPVGSSTRDDSGTRSRRAAAQLAGRRLSPSPNSRHDRRINDNSYDEGSVASQSSNNPRRDARRRAFAAAAERARSASPLTPRSISPLTREFSTASTPKTLPLQLTPPTSRAKPSEGYSDPSKASNPSRHGQALNVNLEGSRSKYSLENHADRQSLVRENSDTPKPKPQPRVLMTRSRSTPPPKIDSNSPEVISDKTQKDQTRPESSHSADITEDAYVNSQSRKPSRQVLMTRIHATGSSHSSRPVVHDPWIQSKVDHTNDAREAVSHHCSAIDSNTQTTEQDSRKLCHLQEVIDSNSKSNDEGIPRVRSMNVEPSGSNLSETTQRVKNTRDKNKRTASPGIKSVSPSRVTSLTPPPGNNFSKDPPATLSVNRDRARLLRNKEVVHNRSLHHSPRARLDGALQVLQKTPVRTESPNIARDISDNQRPEAASKSMQFDRLPSSPKRSLESEGFAEKADHTRNVVSEGLSRKGFGSEHPSHSQREYAVSQATSLKASKSASASSEHVEMRSLSTDNKQRNDRCSPNGPTLSRRPVSRFEAIETASTNQTLTPASEDPSKTYDQRNVAALRTKSNSPRGGKTSTKPEVIAHTPIGKTRQFANVPFINNNDYSRKSVTNYDEGNGMINILSDAIATNESNDVVAGTIVAIDGHSGEGFIDQALAMCSAEKPLASNNAYLVHLQQKLNCTAVPLSLNPPLQVADKINRSPGRIALLPSDSTSSKGKSYEKQINRNDREDDDASSNHDYFSSVKPSVDSMLAYSESDAGSAFSGVDQTASKPSEKVLDKGNMLAKSVIDSNEKEVSARSRMDSTNSDHVASTNTKKKSPVAADSIEQETGIQLNAALQWWQTNYAQNQDKNVNKLVVDALTRSSSREKSHTKISKLALQETNQKSGISVAGDCGSFATDEGSIFSGLDDVGKSNSFSTDGALAKDDGDVDLKIVASSIKVGDCVEALNRVPNGTVPPPPPHKHLGVILDEFQVVNAVNSDITSSIVAGYGTRDTIRTKLHNNIIKEEESCEIEEDDESGLGGKSRSSQKSKGRQGDIGGQSMILRKTAATVDSENGGKSRTSKDRTHVLTTEKDEKSECSGRSSGKEYDEGGLLTSYSTTNLHQSDRKLNEKKFPDTGVNSDIPLFRCGDGYPQIEEKQSVLKTVFMKFGHSVLDRFEAACRGPDIPYAPGTPGAKGDESTQYTAFADQISETHSLAESVMSAMNTAEARKWDEWDRRDSQSASVFTSDNNTEGSHDGTHFTERLTIADTSEFADISERQAAAHQKLIKYTQSAFSDPSVGPSYDETDTLGYTTATSVSGTTSAYDTSAIGISVFDSSSAATSHYETDYKSVLSLEKPKLSVTTDVSNVHKPEKTQVKRGLPNPMSLNQRHVFKNFCSTLKNQGFEVLKQNRDSKWQIRYLTVSKEIQKLKHVSWSESDAEIVECPTAVLWMKRFVSRSVYSSSLIDKQGRGGVSLSHVVKVTAMARSEPVLQVSKKVQRKYKDSVIVVLEFSQAGSARSMAVRCKSAADAHFLCTGLRLCMDVCKREKDATANEGAMQHGKL